MRPRTLRLALAGLLLATATAAHAERPQSGTHTIAKHRQMVETMGQPFAVGYAAGIMSTSNTLNIACVLARTVAELDAFLMSRADPTWTMQEAIIVFWYEGRCDFTPREKTKL
jgi:hypothetical protein